MLNRPRLDETSGIRRFAAEYAPADEILVPRLIAETGQDAI